MINLKNKKKALVLLSGGLDSKLACKILQEQLEIEAIFFILPFSGKYKSDKKEILDFTKKNKIKTHIIDLTKGELFKEYMNLIKNPRFKRGNSLNPCIDCHLFMLKKAKELSKKRKIDIVATGEVLGQRPLSQTKKSLYLIDKHLGFEVLRPLSAKLLFKTEYEKKEFVDSNKLLKIEGKKRKEQITLAKKYGFSFPSPAGGCLLCEKGYCKKLKPLLNKKNLSYREIKLLKTGRHFLDSLIILGKNKEENLILEKEKGIKVIPIQPGPTALITKTSKSGSQNLILKAKELIQKYSKHKILEFKIK